MDREQALRLLLLLSAVESWSFSTKTMLPDYLHDELTAIVGSLSKVVLEDKDERV